MSKVRCESVAWVIEVRIKCFFTSIGGYGDFVITGNQDPVMCYGFMNP